MEKTLMIMEVSRKQEYIFSSRRLRDNVSRSAEISHVTGSQFFRACAGDLYDEQENLVYSGGGHTVLQFSSQEAAAGFARCVTEAALRRYRGMEIFVKTMPYDAARSPGENLTALSAALEKKKALRKAAFRQMSIGVERLDSESYQPLVCGNAAPAAPPEQLAPPAPWRFPTELEKLAGDDSFLAVVHIDGNAMGKRVENLYQRENGDWEACRGALQRFSSGIQADFEAAFAATVERLIPTMAGSDGSYLPIRPLILAGDDVCFITAGKLGLESARVFLEALNRKTNSEDGMPYAACAGIAMVHTKYPFHQAYRLSEELCSSAKRFGAELDPNGSVCAMDWHIEFGQLKDSLGSLREDYETEDSGISVLEGEPAFTRRMELRPVAVLIPDGVDHSKTFGVRTYAFFRAMCMAMKGEYGKIARSKIKELRTAFKQGKIESEYFLRDKEIRDLLYHGINARYRSDDERMEQLREQLLSGRSQEKRAFAQTGSQTERCLFFDAIEMIDHCEFFEEVDT